MPLTVPTHPLAVLPLKLRWPRGFDGVALVLGSIAPDIAYAADGYGTTIHSHAWHALFWWNLPLVLIGVRLTRWAAPTVVAHLPSTGVLRLRDYAGLAFARHPLRVTAASAVLGAASHIVWDAFTHPTVDGGYVWLPALHHEVSPDLPVWWLLSLASDLVGFFAAVALLTVIGRRRLLTTWYGTPPAVTPRPARFWPPVIAVSLLGIALLPSQPVRSFADQAIRCLLISGCALLAGTVAASGGRFRRQLPPTLSTAHPSQGQDRGNTECRR